MLVSACISSPCPGEVLNELLVMALSSRNKLFTLTQVERTESAKAATGGLL